jgi:hypothetical protein
VGAFVRGQYHEELVDGLQVGQIRSGGEVMPASAGVVLDPALPVWKTGDARVRML